MKKSKFYLNGIVVALILNLFLVGCSSTDDSTEPVPERTIITMDTPADSDIDWNKAELVWNEEFNGSKILDDIWVYEPDISDGLQIFQEENVELSGGKLIIHAKEKDGVYTSARLSSKYAFKYGRIEIGAKLPDEGINGIWAKFGLFGNNIDKVGYPQSGEIDIMEYFTNSPNRIDNIIHSTANHTAIGTLLTSTSFLETAEEEFHAYGILWTDKYIKFYIDNPDNITYTFLRPSSPTEDNWPFDKPFFLIIQMVIGGQFGGDGVDASLFPALMEIDYLRVYHPQ